LRGNVDTRINKLKRGEYDAIILAYAGIKRLGLIKEVKYFEVLDTDIMIPAMGQGALGIETINDEAVIEATWPRVDESALIQNTMLIVLQVNGKLRSKIEVPRDIAKADLERLALGDEAIQRFTSNGTVRKIIVVPKRLVNIVVN